MLKNADPNGAPLTAALVPNAMQHFGRSWSWQNLPHLRDRLGILMRIFVGYELGWGSHNYNLVGFI